MEGAHSTFSLNRQCFKVCLFKERIAGGPPYFPFKQLMLYFPLKEIRGGPLYLLFDQKVFDFFFLKRGEGARSTFPVNRKCLKFSF